MWFAIIKYSYLVRKAVNMLKDLAKTSKTPAEDVVVVRDGEEVHRSAENDCREKHQVEVKRKYELERHCRKFSASWKKAFLWAVGQVDRR